MIKFVDLGRQFRALTSVELEQPEFLAAISDSVYLSGLKWSDLLDHSRVLLLAEAGSGKTVEMRNMAETISAQGQHAFFVALETLDQRGLPDVLLTSAQQRRFTEWKEDGRSTAWFFLDAVDELKLTQGKLERALAEFAKSVDGLLDRVKVMLSCRPNDWRPVADMATFKEHLPRFTGTRTLLADEAFAERLTPPKHESKSGKPDAPPPDVLAVMLLPLANSQIETFTRTIGQLAYTKAFIAELDRQRAWTFARRPMDLSDLIASWKQYGTLGTRSQQHEANISSKLRENPDRSDSDVLSDTDARTGAERLALALTLTRARTICAPEQSIGMGGGSTMLDPAAILPDWTSAKRNALLRRALFDPATYGRVRFHHRSVHEYLAARRLKDLREGGMTVRALLRLMFAERFGERVVIPTMRPVAAWLALWVPDVRREVIAREPETLLSEGDPEGLELEVKIQLVRAFADAYGEGSWRGIDIPIDEVRRLATPDLDSVIRETWEQNHSNEDVSELLLQLIWQAKGKGCSDIAEAAGFDESLPPIQRVIAVRALVDSGTFEAARRVLDSMLKEPARWPDKVVHGVVADLFPAIASPNELIALVARTNEPTSSISGFKYQLQLICKTIEPLSPTARELRDGLADLVWRGRIKGRAFYQIESTFGHVALGLAVLCTRQLQQGAHETGPLGRACALAYRFGSERSSDGETFDALRQEVSVRLGVRQAAFWQDVVAMDDLVPDADGWHRYHNVLHEGVTTRPLETDRAWLEAALRDAQRPASREIALQAVAQLWRQRGAPPSEFPDLLELVKSSPKLSEDLRAWNAPSKTEALEVKWRSDQKKSQAAHRQAERRRIVNWKKWRETLLADVERAFTLERVETTISNLYKWLSLGGNLSSRTKVWDRQAVAQAFGEQFAKRAVDALKAYWRGLDPKLRSELAATERNEPWNSWLWDLCGVTAEAETSGWAKNLSAAEAHLATRLATAELNGFAQWISDLAESHPHQVTAVLGQELRAEMAQETDYHLPILQDLSYTSAAVKRVMASCCKNQFLAWRCEPRDGPSAAHAMHVHEQFVQILVETSDDDLLIELARYSLKRFAEAPDGPQALQWLKGSLLLNFALGARAVIDQLRSPGSDAVSVIAAIFGGREGVPIRISDSSERAKVLGELVRAAYEFVRVGDDQPHDGVYRPDVRDRAEEVRNFLLSSLLDTPGPQARVELLALASEPIFQHMPDRLRRLTRERAATEAEFPSFSAQAVRALDRYREAPALDRDGLFAIMLDRIDDLVHDIAHHDFTDRKTLQSIHDEVEMQRTLAKRLETSANGAYTVTREDEAADLKKTDIRLSGADGLHRAVIEVKIGDDRLSVAEFEHALEHQLVGQYLRHPRSKAGCMLLTYNGKTIQWPVDGGKESLSFEALISRLSALASQLERTHGGQICLAVVGVDLRDPPLVPAQLRKARKVLNETELSKNAPSAM